MKHNKIKASVQDIDSEIFYLSARFIQLEAVQRAVSDLMERIDEITYNNWDKEPTMARLSINELEKTVRLIDLGFSSLFKEMHETLSSTKKLSSELFDIVVKSNESDNND